MEAKTRFILIHSLPLDISFSGRLMRVKNIDRESSNTNQGIPQYGINFQSFPQLIVRWGPVAIVQHLGTPVTLAWVGSRRLNTYAPLCTHRLQRRRVTGRWARKLTLSTSADIFPFFRGRIPVTPTNQINTEICLTGASRSMSVHRSVRLINQHIYRNLEE